MEVESLDSANDTARIQRTRVNFQLKFRRKDIILENHSL
jgi:hypothetical protein